MIFQEVLADIEGEEDAGNRGKTRGSFPLDGLIMGAPRIPVVLVVDIAELLRASESYVVMHRRSRWIIEICRGAKAASICLMAR